MRWTDSRSAFKQHQLWVSLNPVLNIVWLYRWLNMIFLPTCFQENANASLASNLQHLSSRVFLSRRTKNCLIASLPLRLVDTSSLTFMLLVLLSHSLVSLCWWTKYLLVIWTLARLLIGVCFEISMLARMQAWLLYFRHLGY